MSATLTQSGTWTPLNSDITPFLFDGRQLAATTTAQQSLNVPFAASLNGNDFRTVPAEVYRLIELIQEGYGTGAAPNIRKVSFWGAATLLRTWLNAIFDSQTAQNPTSAAVMSVR